MPGRISPQNRQSPIGPIAIPLDRGGRRSCKDPDITRHAVPYNQHCPMPTQIHFADSLANAIRESGNPVVVGLDPRWESLPDGFRGGRGDPLDRQATAYAKFCAEVVDVVASLAPAVKIQSA